ncbi:MAG: hypothetical protein K8F92_04515 [Hyphomicrobium sp.]|uniref:hypothetical protein n=1 Tax=Hyphomicrobium sp. TaxID=82 RepID=UPI0013296A3A|nr:hypothetical protein [Hyphomicrobium sp.]KAB2943633.1 MAG: hypothetical protein F9K20_02975 [Hyphomicrobium sp.]MBZ0208902.1 hypothetical protein [Hyphomicrobium sp.]
MIADAGYAPEMTASLTQVFEDAWVETRSRATSDHHAERLRSKLAGIVMLLGQRLDDPDELRRRAVRLLAHGEGWSGDAMS